MVAKYNRGSQNIRRQIADEQRGAASYVAQITSEANRADRAEARLNDAREEIAALKTQLQEQQLLNDKIATLERQLEASRKDAHEWYNAYRQRTRGWEKLSVIVKMALSPEQYQQARQDAAYVHPKLFKPIEDDTNQDMQHGNQKT